MTVSEDILFDVRDGVARVTLNRPKALNAVTLEMLHALDGRLAAWAEDDAVAAVVIGGEGRAFAAGGDIRRLYDAGKAGDPYTEVFFRDEYRVNRRIFHYPKPYIALINGVTMGGGVGLSVHGSHRIATENTMFAMPETGIGFFPDVGGTYFLPRLPGRLGLYMALTGARLGGADCLHAGIATHYVPSERLSAVEEALCSLKLSGSDIQAAHATATVAIERLAERPTSASIEGLRSQIDRCFGADSVEQVIANLRTEGSDWATKQAETILARSPTALKVAFEQVRRGASLDLDQALVLEFRISQEFMRNPDFYEGVRAAIIDKDQAPKWRPARLEEVTDEAVARYFAPLGDKELSFVTASEEAGGEA